MQRNMTSEAENLKLIASPIGFVSTGMRVKFEAPHQPLERDESRSVIELLPGNGYERALQDLAGFDRIWLLWWFHRNQNWRPQVMPPRGPARRRGVFATRSPHRPNPIGITAVRLISVHGLRLEIGACDLIDGTPILDIKPYLTTVDSFPEASLGWVGELEQQLASTPQYQVIYEPLASEQLAWLIERGIDIRERALPILTVDPTPHRTRRISRLGGGLFRMGCGAWKIIFSMDDNIVNVREITRGYPLRILQREGYDEIPDRELQIEFVKLWPNSTVERGEPPIL